MNPGTTPQINGDLKAPSIEVGVISSLSHETSVVCEAKMDCK